MRPSRCRSNDPKRRLPWALSALVAAGIAASPAPSSAQTAPSYGYTQGKLDVGPMGSATVTIPIEVAPGIHGLQPDLTIGYDSHNGANGPLGLGFGLRGLSAIHLCPKSLFDHGERGQGATTSERLCLDGKPLLSETGATDDVGYWNSVFFRTEHESGVRVQRRGSYCLQGVCFFDVHHPSGSRATYGRNGTVGLDTMVAGFGSVIEGHGNTTQAWLIRQVEDAHGNRMTYEYEIHENSNYPLRVTYGPRSVELIYEDKTYPRDITRSRYPAFERVQSRRLRRIEARVEDQTFKSYDLEYGHFDDSAGQPGPSQLVRVQECDGVATCHEPLLIDWHTRSRNDHTLGSAPYRIDRNSARPSRSLPFVFADFDGRGRPAMLRHTSVPFMSGSIKSWKVTHWYDDGQAYSMSITDSDVTSRLEQDGTQVVTGDFDGDGRTDLITQLYGASSHVVQIHFSRGVDETAGIFGGHGVVFETVEVTGSENGDSHPMYNHYHNVKNLLIHTGDFNGDGLTDLMRQERGAADNDRNSTIRVYLSNGDGSFRVTTPGNQGQAGDQIQDHLRYDLGYRIYPGDHNGDGLTDFIAVNVDSRAAPGDRFLRVFLSRGDGHFDLVGPTGDNGMRAEHLNVIPGDFNGDGKMDFIRQEKGAWAQEEVHTFRLYLSRGDGSFFKTPSLHRLAGQNMSGDLAKLLPGDFNGDGKTDFVRQVYGEPTSDPSDAFGVFYSLGDGDFNYVVPTDPRYQDYMRYDYETVYGVELFVADFNGDGQADILSRPRRNVDHLFELHPLQAEAHPNHLVKSISTGNGMTSRVTYFPIARGGLQASGKPYVHADVPAELTAVYGPRLHHLNSGLNVVREIERFATADETATTERQTFTYEGMVVEAGGVGAVGFQSITSTHHAHGTKSVRSMYVDPDLRGLLKTDESFTVGGELLSRETYTWTKSPADATIGTHFVQLASSVKESYEGGELATSLTREFGYDGHGNPIFDRRIEGAVVRATTCRAFDKTSQGGWHRGRILSETIVAGNDCTLSGDTCSCGSAQLLRQKALVYDGSGNVIEERSFDDENNTWEVTAHAYDSRGNVVATTDPAGVVTTYAYESTFDTLRREVVDPSGANLVTTFVFDPRFGETRLNRGPNGAAIIEERDDFGRLVTRMLEPVGDRADDTWACIAGTCGATPARETLEEIRYFDVGGVERTMLDDGQVIGQTRTFTNHRDQEIRRELVGEGGSVLVRTFDYDLAGRVVAESEPHAPGQAHASTDYTYDARGRPVSIATPNDVVATIAYGRDAACDANEIAIRTTLAGGSGARETLECRDLRDEVTRRRYGAGATTEQRFAFDALGRITRLWSPDASGSGAVLDTVYRYDALGRRVEIDHNERGQTYFLFAQGRLVEKSHGSDVWAYEYDSAGRITAEVQPDGTRHEKRFDGIPQPFGEGLPNRVQSVDPSGQVTSARHYTYDALGQMLNESVEVHGRTYAIGYTHRSDGVLSAVTYPDGSRLDVGRDQLGNMTALSVEETENGTPTSTLYAQLSDYSVRGQPGRIAFSNGVATDYVYDGIGRLDRVTTSSQSGAFVDKTYTWSDFGEIIAVADELKASHSQTFVYDELGYLTQATGPYGTRSYAYDAHGNLTQKGSLGLTYQGGRPVSSSQGDVFDYDARGNRSAKHTAGGATLRYHFSGLDQLTDVQRETRGSTCDPDPQVPCADVATELLGRYAYDATGARVKKTDVNGVVSLYISPLYEVTLFPNGTELHTRYLNGPAGRIVAISDEVLPPSTQGGSAQAVFWTSPRLPVGVAYTLVALLALAMVAYWIRAASKDGMVGRVRAELLAALRAMQLVDAELEARWSVAYGTEFMRRRRGRAAAVPLCAAYVAIAMTGCAGPAGDEVVKIRGGAHGVERLDNGMVYGHSSRALLPGANGDGYPVAGTHFFHPDHLGSSTYVTDALGHKVAETVYTPYGEVFDPASTGVDVFRSKFSGKEFDAGAELYFFEARHYDPVVGRFIQADTMAVGSDSVLASDLNRYAYAGNSPIVFTDPSGRLAVFASVLLTAFVVGMISGTVSVGVSVASSYILTGQPPSWKEVGIDFAVGFVSGAISGGSGAALAASGRTFAFKAAGTIAANYAGGFLGTVTKELLTDGKFTGDDWLNASINGMVDALTASVIDVPTSKLGNVKATMSQRIRDNVEAEATRVRPQSMSGPRARLWTDADVRFDRLRRAGLQNDRYRPLDLKIKYWTDFNKPVFAETGFSGPGLTKALMIGLVKGGTRASIKKSAKYRRMME